MVDSDVVAVAHREVVDLDHVEVWWLSVIVIESPSVVVCDTLAESAAKSMPRGRHVLPPSFDSQPRRYRTSRSAPSMTAARTRFAPGQHRGCRRVPSGASGGSESATADSTSGQARRATSSASPGPLMSCHVAKAPRGWTSPGPRSIERPARRERPCRHTRFSLS